MSVRTTFRCAALLGILIGAGGCSSDSPTAPFEPSSPVANKSGFIGSGNKSDTTTTSTVSSSSGGYIGVGSVTEGSTLTTSSGGGYIGVGSATGGYIGVGN
jgi:hypothetical protein